MPPISEPLAQPPSPPSPGELQDNLFLRFLVRIRYLLFALLAVGLVASFNGQWRVGRDSALYCDVARNLAEGHGYTFRHERERHVYPGLPLLLAATQRIFGPQDPLHPAAYLVLMVLLGAATLVTVYHLARAHYPTWVAVCVTTGVGVNKVFLEHSNELMSDIPFLLGVCLTLLGIARLPAAMTRRQRVGAIVLLALGALLAISTRPTFWALAVAWIASCVIGLVRSSRPKPYLIGLVAFVLLALGYFLVDPRLRGNLLSGKYENNFFQHLGHLGSDRWTVGLYNTFAKHIPDAVLGFWTAGPCRFLLLAFSVSLVLASLLLMRRARVAGLYVLATITMILLLGSVPRYFLMVLPLFLIEWALLCHAAATRIGRLIPWRFTPDWVMLIGLAVPTVANVGQSLNFIFEQHGRNIVINNTRDGRRGGLAQFLRGDWKIDRGSFLSVYRGGKMAPVVRLAHELSRLVPPNQRVFGPEPRILTYLSRRDVFDTSDLLGNKQGNQWLSILTRKNLTWCVWGPRFPEEVRIVTALRKRLILVDASALPGGNGSPWLELEPVGPGGGEDASGIYIARIQGRSANSSFLSIPWRRLPATDLRLYSVKAARPSAKPGKASTSPATRPAKAKPRRPAQRRGG